MNSEQIYALFEAVDEDYRMLCIDAAAVGCYLYHQGQEAAGLKLLHTAIVTAGMDGSLVQFLLENPKKSLAGLAMHAEIRSLVKIISV